jgi:hypothetical protein
MVLYVPPDGIKRIGKRQMQREEISYKIERNQRDPPLPETGVNTIKHC